MRIILLDGGRFTDKAEAHAYMAKVLGFPPYYGKNLDALADALAEIPRDTGVIIANTEKMRESLGEYACGITDTFRDVLGACFRVCIFE